MTDAFPAALDELLTQEGGFENDPRDKGGPTNLGVTMAEWERYTGRPATEADLRALTPEKVAPLYRRDYWQACNCDKLPAGLALCVFDFAVNAGPGRAVRFLQRLVSAKQDGQCGAGTLGCLGSYLRLHGLPAAIQAYQDMRREYYRSLPTFRAFGRGWLRRCDEVQAMAEGMK